jgi:hypothetical protein
MERDYPIMKQRKLDDCKLCEMGRYILTDKMSKIMRARKIILVCKICGCPLLAGLSKKEAEKLGKPELMGDEVESKQQRRGKTKLYHAKCYDDSHFDSPDDGEEDE